VTRSRSLGGEEAINAFGQRGDLVRVLNTMRPGAWLVCIRTEPGPPDDVDQIPGATDAFDADARNQRSRAARRDRAGPVHLEPSSSSRRPLPIGVGDAGLPRLRRLEDAR